MKTLLSLALISAFVSTLSLQAYSISEMPKPSKRVNPIGDSNIVYSYHDAIKNATQAVVNISTQKKVSNQINANPMFNDPFFQQFFGDLYNQIPRDRVERSLGSGVIVSSDGYIITNNHVIDGADKIIVTLPGDTNEYTATLIGTDKEGDIAIIRINKNNLPFIKFADSSDVKVGDVVFAIGNPFGVGETVTQGIVSATNKNIQINAYENFIQTDASINPGNSGGALIDSRGALIGMNTAILSRTGGNHGVGFAIPANMVKEVANSLVKDGKIQRGYIGVGTQDISQNLRQNYGDTQGAVVVSIDPNSPAKKAGLLVWDLITAVNDTSVKDSAQLRNAIGSLKPNSKITLSIIRDGKPQKITLTLAERKDGSSSAPVSVPESSEESSLKGMRVEPLTAQIRQRYRIPDDIEGVIVTNVANNSQAQEVGFAQGDIIAQVEDITIKDTADFTKALNKYKGKTKRFLVYSDEGIKTIVTK
ncbi:Do family serine endopeptidase [Helicobacter fennelliae]|uniref:HtrA protease n=1 Tax=Helicobacter fennelliae MRY12-0050 TaxID=1325130 RepID=T1CXU4_9HELI|nr:Do family serine endopeptidase [Helicobacter fennelliae]GAD18770.1 HtrA protease [Helicobacter fennelliae MRY12-0050]STP07067.1 serine protease [Helicobacter fennelliae]STQ83386.1 serine protease [Helicobacter fennelliae]